LLVTLFKNKPNLKFKIPYQVPEKPYKLLGQLDNSIYGAVDLSNGKTPDYMVWLERQFGKEITSRTIQTINRVLGMFSQEEEKQVRDICAEKFKDFQFGLKLILQNTGQREFVIGPETVDAPDKILSEWVVASYRDHPGIAP